MTNTERLLEISSGPLGLTPASKSPLLAEGILKEELSRLLELKNGFYAFESALHIFPAMVGRGLTLEEWNSESLWRNAYEGIIAPDLVFFGEDVFQDQFCISPAHGVMRFKAETGQTVFMADSLEKWAAVVLSDFRYETGWTTANEWQAIHGPLPEGKRLMPKTPFFLGGEYSLENLWAGDAIEGMRFKGDIAVQTRHLAEGSKVRLRFGPKPVN
jgi:hypothetical protein